MSSPRFTRRGAIKTIGVGLFALRAGTAFGRPVRQLTPACANHDDTPPILAGPYFKPGSPERRNLRERPTLGVLLTLSGRVLDERCRPVVRSLLDFWQCDNDGVYDRRGMRLRGHQYTDNAGRYLLSTIVPNHYQRRTAHVHVKVQAPHGPILTTQLFFPSTLHAYGMDVSSLNARDQFFDPKCLTQLRRLPGGQYAAKFDFIIRA